MSRGIAVFQQKNTAQKGNKPRHPGQVSRGVEVTDLTRVVGRPLSALVRLAIYDLCMMCWFEGSADAQRHA